MYKSCSSFFLSSYIYIEDYLLRTRPDHHYQEKNQLENESYSTRNQPILCKVVIIKLCYYHNNNIMLLEEYKVQDHLPSETILQALVPLLENPTHACTRL